MIKGVAMWHNHKEPTEEDVEEGMDLYMSFLREFKEFPLLLNMTDIASGKSILEIEEQIDTKTQSIKWEKKKESLNKTNKGKVELLLQFVEEYSKNTIDNLEYKIESYKLHFDDKLSIFRYIKESGVSGGVKRLKFLETKELIKNYPLEFLEFEVIYLSPNHSA